MSDPRGKEMASALGRLFAWAVQHRRVVANPTVGMYRPKSPPSRHRALSDAELRWLWAALDEVGWPFAHCVKLLILTGARRSEVAGMEWSELTDDLSVWNLPERRSKNKLPHVVYLPPLAREIIASAPRVAGARHVLTTNGTSHVKGFSKCKVRLDAIMLRLAKKGARDPDLVAIPAWRIHDLRRTVVTKMGDIGVLPHVVEAVVNHVSGHKAGIAGVYNKAKYAIEKMDALERWAVHVHELVS